MTNWPLLDHLSICLETKEKLKIFPGEEKLKFLIMGRVFLDHIGGIKLYSCGECNTNLTNKSELISTRFTGATGTLSIYVINL